MNVEATNLKNSPLLTIDEMGQQLKVPVNTIYYWVHRREIPFLKMGRHLRFRREEVLDFFDKKVEHSRPTCPPLAELLEPKPWFREASLGGSLKTRRRALLKQKE